jgi:hypothetical protein
MAKSKRPNGMIHQPEKCGNASKPAAPAAGADVAMVDGLMTA